MKKETIDFILWMFHKEFEAEYAMDHPKPLEVEYVRGLMKAGTDFAACHGDWIAQLSVGQDIENLIKDDFE